jgi:predicted MFS family arabinose efflux permease
VSREGNAAAASVRSRQIERQLVIFLVALGLLGATGGMFETTFNNFLNDTFHLSAATRGQLEFPRELPGFLTALFAGALFFLPEVRLAALAALTVSIGLFGIAFLGQSFWPMLVMMMVWSIGIHTFMPLESAIALGLAAGRRRGSVLGRLQGVGAAGTMVGCGFVWLGLEYAGVGYRTIFIVAACGACLASLTLTRMARPPAGSPPRPRFVFKRRYSLYYTLHILFGARKQIFLTFGPWVLIQVMHQPASLIAKLWIVAGMLGIIIKPFLGRLIDSVGERAVLMGDAILLVGVCLGYGFSRGLGGERYSLLIVEACFVLDQALFWVEMARSTYLDKIAESRQDVTGSLSLGVSINHAVSMSIPTVGGLVWIVFGYQYVFLAAAGLALITLVAASQVRVPAATHDPMVEMAEETERV